MRSVAVGLLAVAAGLLGRMILEPAVSPDALLVFVLSVIVAAWAGGLSAGLVATAASFVVADYYFVAPVGHFTFSTREAVRLTFFLIEGVIISGLFQQVRRSERAERRAREQLRQFLAVVSHELRNPLNALAASAKVLAAGGGSERAAAIQSRQLQYLDRMVSDINDLSRLEHAALRITRSPIDMTDVLDGAIEIARPEFRDRDQAFETTVRISDGQVIGDAARLQQVFANLLLNASRYTQVCGRISLTATDRGDAITVTIQDDGRGFDPASAEHLFEPFVRFASDQPGTGLGLAICKALIEQHGGSIRAESAGVGCGARFIVALPRGVAAIAGETLHTLTVPDHVARSGR